MQKLFSDLICGYMMMFFFGLSVSSGNAASLDFVSGWNLASSPVPVNTAEIFANQDSFISIWVWRSENWEVYLPGEADHGLYAAQKGFGLLTTINPGEGFWVKATSASSITTPGTPVYGDLSFSNGWNLVGLKDNKSITVADFLAGKSEIISLWKWQNGKWAVYLPGEVNPGLYATSQGFSQFTAINPGEGFWVNMQKTLGPTITTLSSTTTSTTMLSTTTTTTLLSSPPSATPTSIKVPVSDSDGNYTVSWSASSTAGVTYTLQEATNNNFTKGLRTVYTGSAMNITITGRTPCSTYYYRVCAQKTDYTDSAWEAVLNGCLVNGQATKDPVALATNITSGGAFDIYADNGRIYFSDYNRSAIYSVSECGGEVTSHYLIDTGLLTLSPWRLLHTNNKIYIINSNNSDDGGLLSLPDDAIGITPFYYENFAGALDVLIDNENVYWSYDNKVFKISRTITGSSFIENIFTSDTSNNKLHIALDGNNIFISENYTRNIYRIDLTTGTATPITYGLGSGTTNILTNRYWPGMTLAVTNKFLYAMDGESDIYSIDKLTGDHTKIATAHILSPYYETKIKSAGDMLYWWQFDMETLSLKTINSKSGQIGTVATMPMTYNFNAYYPNETDIYWFTWGGEPTGLMDYAWRVPASGGAVTKIATSPTHNGFDPYYLYADDHNLYWTSRSQGGLFTMPKTGGLPTKFITTMSGPIAGVIDSQLYLADFEGIKKVPIAGQTLPKNEWSINPDSSSFAVDITRDGDNLYWIVNNNGSASNNYVESSIAYSMPIAGGATRVIATSSDKWEKIFYYNEYLYFIKMNINGDGSITRLPKTGGQEELIVETVLVVPADIFVINNMLYFTLNSAYLKGVYQIDLTTWQVKLLTDNPAVNNQLYVDDTYIYVTEDSKFGGGVHRLPLKGGNPQTLYSGLVCYKITGDEHNIYWAAGTKIFKMTK